MRPGGKFCVLFVKNKMKFKILPFGCSSELRSRSIENEKRFAGDFYV